MSGMKSLDDDRGEATEEKTEDKEKNKEEKLHFMALI